MVSHAIMFLQRIQPCNRRTYIILYIPIFIRVHQHSFLTQFNLQYVCLLFIILLPYTCIWTRHQTYASTPLEFPPFSFEDIIWIWGLWHHCTNIEIILSNHLKINQNSCKHICIQWICSVKTSPQLGTSTNHDQNPASSEKGQFTSACQIRGHSFVNSLENAPIPQNWHVSLPQNCVQIRKIDRQWPQSHILLR